MGWPLFKARSNNQAARHQGQSSQLSTALSGDGVIFSSDSAVSGDWLEIPSTFGAQAELVSLLSQLKEEGFAQRHDQELLLPWPAFYELACSRDYQDSISLLSLPKIEEWRPVLSSRGSLSDQVFSVIHLRMD